MKDKIKPLIDRFREVESLPHGDREERNHRQQSIESWFRDSIPELKLKSEPGLNVYTDSLGIDKVKYHYFTFVDAFDDINILITARFGGKRHLHEVRSFIHFPE